MTEKSLQTTVDSNELETHSMLTLSTAHLTKVEAETFAALSVKSNFSSCILKYEYGIIFRRITQDLLMELREISVPENALQVLQFAIDKKFDMIEFDCDGYVIDALPKHDW